MPLTSPGNDDDTGENHQPTLRKNTAEPVEQTLKQNKAPVYVCYPDPAALPQIGLAVVRAYVPSVTPAEVAGMLSTLRS